MLLDINFLDVGNVSFQKLPMAKNGEKWRKMAKNGDGEFAFFICQIRHFAIGPPHLYVKFYGESDGDGPES